jgi:ribonuclease Z
MSRRIVTTLIALLVVVVAGGSVAVWRLGGMDGVQQLAIRRILQDQRSGLFEDGRLHVFTLGTGSPQLGGSRMPVANAVIAGQEFLILDAGEGASRTMGELGLPVQRVLNQSWNADRNHEVPVHGPEGVERVMEGLHRVYRDDIRYRSLGEVEHNDPAYALGAPVTVSIPDGEPGTIALDRNGVVVRAFHVDHGHVKPAYGYRVEYNGKSVVFSGDTVASPLVVAAAQGCDLLIHEALNTRLMGNAVVALRDLGNEVDAQRAEGVIRYHADTLGVAKVAAEANAAKLVLSHIIPASRNPLLNRIFVSGMREHYAGPIVVAKDGQHFAL